MTESKRLFTFRSGGWIILVASLLCMLIVGWAIAPVVMKTFNRSPGDGQDVASYGFDLSAFAGSRAALAPATLYRDMVPVLNSPGTMTIEEIAAERKALVPVDRVIGVVLNGEARAFPLKYLNVHEIVNTELGGVPIAVTYNWLCDSARVFDRRIDGQTQTFGHSGLVWNSNALLYDVQPGDEATAPQPNASLWSQIQGRALAGPHVDAQLKIIPARLVQWEVWTTLHPETTVMRPLDEMAKRYKKAMPSEYFHRGEVVYPIEHAPTAALDPLARVIVITIGEARHVVPLELIRARCGEEGTWTTDLAGSPVRFDYQQPGVEDDKKQPPTVLVTPLDGAAFDDVLHCFWFAWHTLEPRDPVVTDQHAGSS